MRTHRWPRPAATIPLLILALTLVSRVAADTAADEQRARIVESNLRDLSSANDAAITRQRLTAERQRDALGNPRLALRPEPVSPTDLEVRQDVQSSLHRLRRETVSQRTEDGRTARIQDSQDRATRSEP